jgi:glycosyltransferase involved in cell wall biosynthesis
MTNKIITIVIATFNSEKILPKVLDSIKCQTFPSKNIDVLLVDGGSTDKTIKIAQKYKCKMIKNPRTEPIYAKFLGFLHAKGRYLLYLDHDEVLENKKSLQLKYDVFKSDSNVKAVICSGYKCPKHLHYINKYINEFGDPFSFFMYRLSKDVRFFMNTMKKKYKIVSETKDNIIFDLSQVTVLPIIEVCALGSMIDRAAIQKEFPQTLKKPELIPHFFYLINATGGYLGMTKNDGLLHYSSDTLKNYFNKIRWRVKNNIYFVSDMGASGFSGRQNFSNTQFKYKKYAFIPYVYTIIFCLLDSIYLAATRKDIHYLMHLPLSIFTANLIVYHTVLKTIGHRPQLKSYDEKKVVA